MATRVTELEAQNENAKKALEEAKKREDERRDLDKTQVDRLLALADVVGRKYFAILDMFLPFVCRLNVNSLSCRRCLRWSSSCRFL